MPNQMIALQSRNAPLPDPSRQTAQFANMINMARQTEAAQRQAALAQQQMDTNAAQESRAAALHPSALGKAEADAGVAKLKYVMDFYKASANDIASARDPEQAKARGERLKQQFTDPVLQARIDETIGELVSDPSKFEENRKRILIRTLDAKDQFAVTHKDVFDADGNLILMETSPTGSFPTRVTPGVITNLPSTATASPPAAAPRTPVGTGADMRATQGSNTTQQDLMNQGMDPRNIPSGMPTSPASFTGGMGGAGAGQITPEVMSRIADSAFQTGVMAQVDFDQLLATQPPENRQAFTDAFRRANITIQADAPSLVDSGMGQQRMAANPVQRPQSQFAVYRGEPMQSQTAGLRGAPPMEQTLAQYQVGQQVKGRNPNISPLPGSAQVPLSRVAAEARAGRESPAEAGDKARAERETPAEVAARATATARANAAVETEKVAAQKIPGRKQVSTLIKKVRAAYEALDKAEAIPSEARGGFANAMDYFASSSLGREAQKMVGTTTSKYLSEIINSRKLLATAIKNANNMSAQEMNSNTELQLMLDALTDPTQGIEAARNTLNTLEELYGLPPTAAAAPRAAAAKTPVIPDAARQMLRKNPSPQQRAFFDRTFGKGAAAKVLGGR